MARVHADYVDFHLLETMSSIDQARGGLMGAGVTGKPVWVSLSVDDTDGTKLRSGEPLARCNCRCSKNLTQQAVFDQLLTARGGLARAADIGGAWLYS